jgi:hypothetical protein
MEIQLPQVVIKPLLSYAPGSASSPLARRSTRNIQIRFHSLVSVTSVLTTVSRKFYPSVMTNERGNDTNEGGDTNGGAGSPRPLLGRNGFGPGGASVVGTGHQLREKTHRFLGKSTSNPFFTAKW